MPCPETMRRIRRLDRYEHKSRSERIEQLAGPASNIRVDRGANVLRGMVVAMRGDFKSSGRGHFDADSLHEIVAIGNSWRQGVKSRLGHETMCDNAVGKHLGRVRGFYVDSCTRFDGSTEKCVRANLHFDSTALTTPLGGGPSLASYVMDLAESDPDAISSSLVLRAKKVQRLDSKGKPLLDEDGEEAAPLWIPQQIFGSDIVTVGDAVDGILSSSGAGLYAALSAGGIASLSSSLPFTEMPDIQSDEAVRLGAMLLDKMFPGMSRETVTERLCDYVDNYLNRRFGRLDSDLEARRRRLRELEGRR